ncbi:H-2 class I histocompatibility antigen, Q10 alpha chain-like, partial [Sigmodon hispidus]
TYLIIPLVTFTTSTSVAQNWNWCHVPGSHSLRYCYTLLTWPDLLEPQFFCSVYLDDTHVERLDSRAKNPRLEHCAPWMDKEKPEYWKMQTRDMLEMIKLYKNILNKRLYFYNLSKTGYHTLQALMACTVLPGGNFSHGQFELIFNDQDEFIVLNEDLNTWTAVGTSAETMRQQWEKIGFAKTVRIFLEGGCVQFLLQKLHYGKKILLRKDAPKTHVTHKIRADRKITLRCWAINFYPAEISLTWQKDKKNQTLKMEVIETRPSGDGTFQKWAAIVVTSGEEQRYTCHVNHEGLPEPITLRWEPPQPSVTIMAVVTSLVLGAVLTGAVVTFLIWKRRTKELTTSLPHLTDYVSVSCEHSVNRPCSSYIAWDLIQATDPNNGTNMRSELSYDDCMDTGVAKEGKLCIDPRKDKGINVRYIT